MLCRDQATTYLQRFGYNVVRHPREGIAPLDIIGRQRGVTAYLGQVTGLIAQPGNPPAVKVDQETADINGQTTNALKLGIGLSLLKSVLSALGGGAGVNVAYENAETLTFQFDGVKTDIAAPLDIAKFLNDRVLDSDPLLDQYASGDGQLYVITETIKTNKLTVTAKRKDGTNVELDVPVVKGAVGGSVKVEAERDKSATIAYAGAKSLVFGFRCFEIGLEDGEFKLFTSKPNGSTALSAGAPQGGGTLITPDRLLSFT